LAKCLNCGFSGRTRRAKNWKKWQLCYKCAKELYKAEYKNEKPHGTGYRYPKETHYGDLVSTEIPIVNVQVAKKR